MVSDISSLVHEQRNAYQTDLPKFSHIVKIKIDDLTQQSCFLKRKNKFPFLLYPTG